jgi:hypothetical protein
MFVKANEYRNELRKLRQANEAQGKEIEYARKTVRNVQ